MRFCGVCIITNDVLNLAAFYKEVLCSDPVGDCNHMGFDDRNLAIWNPGDYNVPEVKCMSLMFFIDDAEDEFARLSRINGVKDIITPTIKPWGVKSFSFNDPDGNQVNFIEKI